MADLGLPGSVVEMSDDKPQKALWEVRKAGLNIMMSMKGDGKPVSFIEDCAVPLEHLAEYTDRLTEVFTSTARAAPGMRMPRSARCMCGPSSTCAATARRRCARSPKRRRAGAQYKGAYSGEHGDGLVRSSGSLAVRPALTAPSARSSSWFDPGG
jgi:FAD/FMN-containing dehydrogenase